MQSLLERDRPSLDNIDVLDPRDPDAMRDEWVSGLDYLADEPVGEVSLIPNVLHERNILAFDIKQEPALAKVFASLHRHARGLAKQKREHFYHGTDVAEHTHAMRDPVGYHKRYLAAEHSGATEAELAVLADVARFNTETAFLEFYNRYTFDVGLKRTYAIHKELGLIDGAHDLSVMFENYLSPVQHESEVRRGCNEVAFVGLAEWLATQPGAEHLALVKFSLRNQTPDVKGGYVPEIDKMQVQFSKFVAADGALNSTDDAAIGELALETQPIYINGLAYDTAFVNRFLRSIGAYQGEKDLTRAEIHGHPILIDTRLVPDAVSFMRLLDEFYEHETGQAMMLGEPAEVYAGLSYDDLEELAEERRTQIDEAVECIDDMSYELARSGATGDEVERTLEAMRKEQMFEICKIRPEQALISFNEETYQGILQAKKLEEAGLASEAGGVYASTLENAPDTGGCGEACGIVAVSLTASAESSDERAAQAIAQLASDLGLKAFKDGNFYKDIKTLCGCCGAKGILRGSNGAICMDGCGKMIVNGEIKSPGQLLSSETESWLASWTKKEPLVKSIGRVLREYAERQAMLEQGE